jgi:hypothetical protein
MKMRVETVGSRLAAFNYYENGSMSHESLRATAQAHGWLHTEYMFISCCV